MANSVVELSKVKVAEVSGAKYLTLQLEPDFLVAVQLSLVQETFVAIGDRLTLIPNVAPCLIGLIEHRSSIFWTLDLPQLMGLAPLDSATIDYNIVILKVRGKLLGLATRQIGQVLQFTDEAIRSPLTENLPIKIIPFLRGILFEADRKIYILDAEAIALTDFS